MSHIAFKRQPEGSNGKGVPVFFQILEVINTSDRKAILRCINLLQENVGRIDLHTVKEAEAESIRRLSEDMGWQVLPDNQHGAVIGRVLRRLGSSQKGSARRIQDRFNFILTLEPHRILHSTRGFVGYFVIEFCDGFTVFENLEIDHAMYVVRGRAEELSRLTRTALHARLGQDVERLVHSKGWEERLRKLVKKVRGDQSPNPDEML